MIARKLLRANVGKLHTKQEHTMTLEEALGRPTISIPEAGALFYGLA
jgi:hypothetical protein